jgi:hypothetical protein
LSTSGYVLDHDLFAIRVYLEAAWDFVDDGLHLDFAPLTQLLVCDQLLFREVHRVDAWART